MEARYPIGKFQFEGEITKSVAEGWIKEIEALPGLLLEAVRNMDEEQLDTAYRTDGWTVRQVVHHLADSHMNAYIRFKLALTEDNPVIKPYDEGKWAELPDNKLPVDISLSLLEALHIRWANLLYSINSADLKKTYIHPDSGEVSVGENIGIYSWHGRHHLAHITSLSNRQGW
ncbi:YfiT family bacillithiol transferase [Peribacillus butanolivorans]|uniref:Putative metal-dependent hydrolase DTO10_05890 n=1 Tax=Peribacillus butanolivorans TaxID=421767 RepID=A0ABM6XI33_9BACI|nr:bacillithiol transferase BstA [Peribacillus butanolivorans]AXN38006.1 putative metal-dependent hydrolase [Peribacillus butanolivorans]